LQSRTGGATRNKVVATACAVSCMLWLQVASCPNCVGLLTRCTGYLCGCEAAVKERLLSSSVPCLMVVAHSDGRNLPGTANSSQSGLPITVQCTLNSSLVRVHAGEGIDQAFSSSLHSSSRHAFVYTKRRMQTSPTLRVARPAPGPIHLCLGHPNA